MNDVIVAVAPECSDQHNQTVMVSDDEEVLLNCSVIAFPKPVSTFSFFLSLQENA